VHRDSHLLEKQMFAKVVAGQLNAPARRQKFDDLILVAPPRTLQTICDALDAATRARVVATLEKDRVQAPAHALPPAIQARTSRVDAAPAGIAGRGAVPSLQGNG
jgi:protein required for attachment to host cells